MKKIPPISQVELDTRLINELQRFLNKIDLNLHRDQKLLRRIVCLLEPVQPDILKAAAGPGHRQRA